MRLSEVPPGAPSAIPLKAFALLVAAAALASCGARTVEPVEAGDSEAGTNPCIAGETACSGFCTDLSINPFHCGACDRRCASGQQCFAGTCRAPCRSPLQTCASGCIDVQTDTANCGGCDHRCDPSANCISGRCRSANDPNYVLSRIDPALWVDACNSPGASRVLPSMDDNAETASLPFALRYWGVTLPAGQPVNVCTNGWIGLDGMRTNSLGGMIPSMAAPNSVVAAHWGDLITRAGGICVATIGTAPDRAWVIEWDDAHYCCGDDPTVHLTFEIVIHETSGVIDLGYQTFSNARMGLPAGLEDATGETAVTTCPAGGMCSQAAGEEYRFTPVN